MESILGSGALKDTIFRICTSGVIKMILCTQYSNWGISSAGRASRWHREGRGFDSPILHELCRVLFVNATIVTKYTS